MDEGSKEFQKRIARIQVWSSTVVTLAGVLLGIGSTMLFTAMSTIGDMSTLEKDNPFLLKFS